MTEKINLKCPHCGKNTELKAEIIQIPIETKEKNFSAICIYCTACNKILKIRIIEPEVVPETTNL